MRSITALAVGLAALTAAVSGDATPSASTIAAEIADISNQYKSLTSSLRAFSGSSAEAQAIQAEIDRLLRTTKSAYHDVNLATSIGITAAQSIATDYEALFDPITGFVSAYVDTYPQLLNTLGDAAQATLAADLQQLSFDIDTVALDLEGTNIGVSLFPTIERLDDVFRSAERVIAGPTGSVVLLGAPTTSSGGTTLPAATTAPASEVSGAAPSPTSNAASRATNGALGPAVLLLAALVV